MFTAARAAKKLPATIVAVTVLAITAVWLSVPSFPVARDFEDCAEWAYKISASAERTARIMECGARFAARRKNGGGYAYYDLLQGRSFDIAGPNPTADERARIYSEYIRFLESQRRDTALTEVEHLVSVPEQPKFETTPVSLRSPPSQKPSKRSCLIKGSLTCTWSKLTSAVRNAFASNARREAMATPR
jgi:hypothetical protein